MFATIRKCDPRSFIAAIRIYAVSAARTAKRKESQNHATRRIWRIVSRSGRKVMSDLAFTEWARCRTLQQFGFFIPEQIDAIMLR